VLTYYISHTRAITILSITICNFDPREGGAGGKKERKGKKKTEKEMECFNRSFRGNTYDLCPLSLLAVTSERAFKDLGARAHRSPSMKGVL